jgi:hypothetical protein
MRFLNQTALCSSIKGRIVLNEFVRFASLRDEKHTLMYARQEEFKSKYFTQGQIHNMSPSQTRRSHWILLRLEIDDAELKAKLEAQITELIKKFEWNRFEKEMDGAIYLTSEDYIAIDICLPYYSPSTWGKIERFLRQASALI